MLEVNPLVVGLERLVWREHLEVVGPESNRGRGEIGRNRAGSVGGSSESLSISRRCELVAREAKLGGGRGSSGGGRMNPYVAGVTLLVIGAVS